MGTRAPPEWFGRAETALFMIVANWEWFTLSFRLAEGASTEIVLLRSRYRQQDVIAGAFACEAVDSILWSGRRYPTAAHCETKAL
jgi:hypothetical protein